MFVAGTFTVDALALEQCEWSIAVGDSIALTTMGLASMVMPAVNGWILGDTATKENLADCCYFLAVVVSIGIVFTWLLAVEMRREEQAKLDKD